MLRVVMIAAVNQDGVLAVDGKIPWHLPRDVAHFRARAAGHWLLLGSTTFGQMRGWFTEGQVPLVLTRNRDLPVPGGQAVGSVAEAVELASRQGAGELLVCGGGQVYEAALERADEIILTKVAMDAAEAEDLLRSGKKLTRFPVLVPEEWEQRECDIFAPNPENEWEMAISRLVRRGGRGGGG